LAHLAVNERKEKMGELSATPTADIGSVSTQLQSSVLMALPKKPTLKRALEKKRRRLQTASDSTTLPPPPTDTTFSMPQEFHYMISHDSGSDDDRLIIMGSSELLDGLARAKLWLADGTFKAIPPILFQVYAIHFELVPGVNPVAIYCLVQNKSNGPFSCT